MSSDTDKINKQKVMPYQFDDEEINVALAEIDRMSRTMVVKCKKHLLLLKVLLVVSGILLTVLFEYMMFVSLWYREPIFKAVMIFTPVLAGGIGYLAANIIDRTFDLNFGLFHSEYQFAYEKQFIYSFRGVFQGVHSQEKLWTNIIAGNYIWRVRNKMLEFKEFDGKEVILLLTRNFFDDDVDFECVYMKVV